MSSSPTKEQFQVTSRYKTWSLALMGIGIVSLLIGFLVYGKSSNSVQDQSRFWGTLLQNSLYFLLIVNASMFFICATTLAMAGFQMAFRRVTEAISVAVIPLGIIALIILLALIFGHFDHVYPWLTPNDKQLKGKSAFLNPTFFVIWSVLAISLWAGLGYKMRKLSRELDENPLPNAAEAKKYIFKNTIWSSLYIVWYALTVASTIPWLWLMSIDAHWASTMYSWYTFASTFVSGLALITIFVVYLKNKGYLELVNEEHLHDLGKFMFAFSIFWCYLWFAQYMLIWYSNQPEETTYFIDRIGTSDKISPYYGMFMLNIVLNFLAPLLILMRRGSKRNYTTMMFMAIVIIFGHWLDFYQMVFPALSKDPVTRMTHVPMNLFDFGVAAGFVGLVMFATARALAKAPLSAKNHPFFKESIIHHT
jgi:hypothetical protein